MKPVTIVTLAAVIAVAGTWSQKKVVSSRMVIGGAFMALMFAALQEAQPKLAEQMSWLVLVAMTGAYGEDLFTMIGDVTAPAANKVISNGKSTKADKAV